MVKEFLEAMEDGKGQGIGKDSVDWAWVLVEVEGSSEAATVFEEDGITGR